MGDIKKKISPALFGIILLCFLLPFLNISCQGEEVAQVSGLSMVTGTTLEGERVDPHPAAIAAFVMAIIGLGIAFWKDIKGNIAATVAAVVGFISLIVLKSNIKGELIDSGYMAIFNIEWCIGYSLTLFIFLGAAVYNFYLFITDQSPELGGTLGSVKDKFDQGVSTISSKTQEMVESSKIRTEINRLKQQKRSALEEMGAATYTMMQQGQTNDEELQTRFSAIAALDEAIANKEIELEQTIKATQEPIKTAVRTCECGTVLKEGDRFCPNCGMTVEVSNLENPGVDI